MRRRCTYDQELCTNVQEGASDVNDRESAYRAAQLYYLQDQTMDMIAGDLGVSRSTVSRLLT